MNRMRRAAAPDEGGGEAGRPPKRGGTRQTGIR
jgi:hypothetical protein